MAWIDDLVSEVSDERLRNDLKKAVSQLRDATDFGLVFEHHHETGLKLNAPATERERER